MNKITTAVQRGNLLRRLRGRSWGCNSRTTLRVYKQYIRPVLEFGAPLLTSAPQTTLNKLAQTERMLIRRATYCPPRTRNDEIYQIANIQPLTVRLQMLKDKYMDKTANND